MIKDRLPGVSSNALRVNLDLKVPRYLTPLRYPGGKQRLGLFFGKLIALNELSGITHVEPFAGGAGVALHLLMKNLVSRIHLNDVDRSIYAFWYAATKRTDELIRRIRRTRVSVSEWDRQKDVQRHKSDVPLLDLGFSTLFLNRTNRSGILRAGMIGGRNQLGEWKLNARYDKDSLTKRVELVGSFRRRLSLSNEDSRQVEDLTFGYGADSLVYLDPPYYEKGPDLYVNHFVPEDHVALSKCILGLERASWIVTYDDVPAIRKLYRTHVQKRFDLDYSADGRRVGSELMVLSCRLRAPRAVLA